MRIEHVAMYVKDIEKAKDFFQLYFDGKPNELYHNKEINFKSYFLTFDNGARLEIMSKPDLPNEKTEFGFVHIAISVGSKQKVDELTKKIKNDGYKIVSDPRTTGDGYYESVVADIEGNLIEITI